jgi:hypothetical protein
MLVVLDGKNDRGYFYCPNGNLPDGVWSTHRMAVVERISNSSLQQRCLVCDH